MPLLVGPALYLLQILVVPTKVAQLIAVLVGTTIGVVFYGGIALVLKMEEAELIMKLARNVSLD